MKIPDRIKIILSLIPQCDVLMDVGCDHGILGVAALQEKKVEKVVFTDISLPSLKKAEALVKLQGLEDKCRFLHGDGFCGERADCVVIAGMGGKEILKIIDNGGFLPEYMVLNPMRNADTVRRALQEKYFFQLDEKFFDKKFYDVMALKRGGDSLTETEIKYGKTNIALFGKDFIKFLHLQQSKYNKINDVAKSSEVKKNLEEIDELLSRSKNV